VKSHVELIEKFIAELPESGSSTDKKKIPNPESLDIVFKDVGYTPTGTQTKIYDNFNLRIYPKSKVAIIGNSASGKSTGVKLLLKLHTYQSGNIFINGIPLTDIDISDLRDKIVYIPQHPKLFNRTLWENISYGLPSNINKEDILQFLKDNEFIDMEREFRKRMDDKVGKQGSLLSGGQRSIVWMIRAILKNASLIILDEPESSLDPLNRANVKKMINVISQNRGLIMITHDMSMADEMDRVIRIDKGKIVSDNNKNTKLNNTNQRKTNNLSFH
jgi:ATP-binding cassette subfamily B protein